MEKVLIFVGGGIGDQICAEPAIRYACERLSDQIEISVLSPVPEFYEHIKGIKQQFKIGLPSLIDIRQYVVRGTYPEDKDDLGKVLCSLHTNGVDYCSMMSLKWMLPMKDREIFLQGMMPQSREAHRLVIAARTSIPRAVFLHPGQSWQSKTFPAWWWETVAEYICAFGGIPVIVGAKVGPTGTVGTFPSKCIDIRDKLSLQEMTWFMQNCTVLLTNDSAPLHMAQSRDPMLPEYSGRAWVGMLATSKHPDFLTHWRHGKWGYHTENLTSGGIWSKSAFMTDAKTATEEEILSWLPEAKTAATWAWERICGQTATMGK